MMLVQEQLSELFVRKMGWTGIEPGSLMLAYQNIYYYYCC